jgi:hypothetical protein
MYRTGVVAAIIVYLTGCVTEKQRQKICASCAVSISTKDSTVASVKERTITVTVHDTIETHTPNPCAELCDSAGKLKKFDKVIPGKKAGTRSRLYTRNDSLFIDAISDSLKALGTAHDSLIKHFREVKEQVPAHCEKRHITDWEIFRLMVGTIALIILAGWLILKILSRWVSWLKFL